MTMRQDKRPTAAARPIDYRAMTRTEYSRHPLRQRAENPALFWVIVALILGAAMCGTGKNRDAQNTGAGSNSRPGITEIVKHK